MIDVEQNERTDSRPVSRIRCHGGTSPESTSLNTAHVDSIKDIAAECCTLVADDLPPGSIRYYGRCPRGHGNATLGQQTALAALSVAAGISGRKRTRYAIDHPADLIADGLNISRSTANKHLAALAALGLVAIDRAGTTTTARIVETGGYFPVPLAPLAIIPAAERPAANAALAGLCDVLTAPGRPGMDARHTLNGEAATGAVAARSGISPERARIGLAALVTAGIIRRVDNDGYAPWWSIEFDTWSMAFTARPVPLTATETADRLAMTALDALAAAATQTTIPAKPLDPPPDAPNVRGEDTGNAASSNPPLDRVAKRPGNDRGENRPTVRKRPKTATVAAIVALLDRLDRAGGLADLARDPHTWQATPVDPASVANHLEIRHRADQLANADLEALADSVIASVAARTWPTRLAGRPAGIVAYRIGQELDRIAKRTEAVPDRAPSPPDTATETAPKQPSNNATTARDETGAAGITESDETRANAKAACLAAARSAIKAAPTFATETAPPIDPKLAERQERLAEAREQKHIEQRQQQQAEAVKEFKPLNGALRTLTDALSLQPQRTTPATD